MTVVAGLADPASNTVLLVADSRVTAKTDGAHFDVCQKVVQLGDDGLIGVSGRSETAEDTVRWITGTYKKKGVEWLSSGSEVLGMLDYIGVMGQKEPNAFLVAFMDARRHATLVQFSNYGEYSLTHAGIKMVGTGSRVYDSIRPEMAKIMMFGGGGFGGSAAAQRALFFSEMVVSEAKRESIDSVGGLMQVHFVEREGTRAIPYKRWVDVNDTHGTYMTMDINEDGLWVQIHEPSGLRVPLRFPSEPEFNRESENFELETCLTPDTPGVVARPNPILLYQLFLTEDDEVVVRTP